MKKVFNTYFFRNILIAFFILTLIYSIGEFYQVSKLKPLKIAPQNAHLNFNPKFLEILCIGQQRFLASLLWTHTMLFSDLEHYQKDDLKSWIYLRIRSISELDPLFYEAYLYGGIYLSIIKDDKKGAANIYERGLEKFPDDYHLNLNAAFNYYNELKEYEKAIPLLQKIQNDPRAPRNLPSLLARLKGEVGNIEVAFQILLSQWKSLKKISILRDNLSLKLYALKAEIDLKCLNKGHINCSYKDFFGRNYLKDNQGFFKAQDQWEKFRIKKRASSKSPQI